MNILKPKSLKKGCTIGLISPASSPDDASRIEKSASYFNKLGYHTIVGKNASASSGYLAGTDPERLEDIQDMFSNKNVDAIICIRGGYGSGRLLASLPYKLIRKNPKIFVGYSDITALHSAFLAKAGMLSFAGPMATVDFAGEPDSYMEENFWKMVTSKKALGKLPYPVDRNIVPLFKGKAEGVLFGGNLTVLTSILGTPYFPSANNNVLFLEDIDEKPYRVDRMLNQLQKAGVLKKLSGVVLGQFTDCVEPDGTKKSLTLEEIFQQYLGGLKIPVIANFPHGHFKQILTLPVGGKVKINGNKGTLEVLESAVI